MRRPHRHRDINHISWLGCLVKGISVFRTLSICFHYLSTCFVTCLISSKKQVLRKSRVFLFNPYDLVLPLSSTLLRQNDSRRRPNGRNPMSSHVVRQNLCRASQTEPFGYIVMGSRSASMTSAATADGESSNLEMPNKMPSNRLSSWVVAHTIHLGGQSEDIHLEYFCIQ